MDPKRKSGANDPKSALSPVEKAKSDALRLITFRVRSEDELRRRLKMRRHSDETVEETVAFLKSKGFVDDEKFAQLYANSRLTTRPAGLSQVERELRQKGVSKDIAARTMASLPEYDEKQAAAELVKSRFIKMTGVSAEKKKARLFAFLRRRGFSSAAVLAALSELFKGEVSELSEPEEE